MYLVSEQEHYIRAIVTQFVFLCKKGKKADLYKLNKSLLNRQGIIATQKISASKIEKGAPIMPNLLINI